MYEGLHTNLPKEVMLLRGASVAPAAWSFASHAAVQAQLAAFAGSLDMHATTPGAAADKVAAQPPLTLHLRTPVTHVDPILPAGQALPALPPPDALLGAEAQAAATQYETRLPPGAEGMRWSVKWQHHEGGSGDEEYDFVAVCNGHYATPNAPCLPSSSEGSGIAQVHSSAYRTPQAFTGQRVLVVGAGPSGQDIAREVATCAATVFIACREVAHSEEAGTLAAAAHHASGTPVPGRISAPVEITKEGDAVVTGHGERVPIDVVIWCTGYEYAFPFLDVSTPSAGAHEQALVGIDTRRVFPLFKNTFHAGFPTLAFVGLPWAVNPNPFHQHQADALAAVWSRPPQSTLPSPAQRVLEQGAFWKWQAQERGRPTRHALRLSADQWAFLGDLRQAVGLAPPSADADAAPAEHPALVAGHANAGRVWAVPHSTLRAADIVVDPHPALLLATLHPEAVAESGEAWTTAVQSTATARAESVDALGVSFPGSNPGSPSRNTALHKAYEAVRVGLSATDKLLLDQAMYTYNSSTRTVDPAGYRLQEFRFGDFAAHLPEAAGPANPAVSAQGGPAAATPSLAAAGVQRVVGRLAQQGDFWWVVRQFQGWYVAAPLGCAFLTAGKGQTAANHATSAL